MNIFWKLMLLFLTLGVDGDDGAGDDAGAGDADASSGDDDGAGDDAGLNADDAGTGDDTLDDLIDHVEDAPRNRGGNENAAIKEARLRADKLASDLEIERQARIAAESRAAPQRQSDDQRLFEQEELQIKAARDSGNAETLKWTEWQINSNRAMRANTASSQQALRTAEDVADKSAFERLEVTKPKVFKRYADRVEKAMTDMRAKGQNAPRLAVLRLLIGDDIMNGKIGAKTRKASSADGGQARAVDRGRTPGARTDVGSGGRLTEHQKRTKRLENVRI